VRAWVIVRRVLIALAGCAVIGVIAALGLAAAIGAGWFRGAVVRFIAVRAGRPIDVAGALQIHLFTRHPDLRAERVTIGNPAWVPAGQMAQIDEVSLVTDVPWTHGKFGIVSLSLKGATLHLMRNAAGYANWQVKNPDVPPDPEKLPILRSLTMPGARVTLDDARRHLQFDGIVSVDGGGAGPGLTIKGDGQLNGAVDSFEITGDPLAAASHHLPYHFAFAERSSGSELKGHGVMPKPFDFNIIDAMFDTSGSDLRDLYFLTGVKLVNSGQYRLSGRLEHRGKLTRLADLAATTGQSDIRGSLAVDTSGIRPRATVELESQFLRMADFGLRAAGRAPETGAPPLLLSNAMLNPTTLRRDDVDIRYRARELEVGRVVLSRVAAQGTLERGVLTVTALTADILGGKLRSHAHLDATTDDPKASVDIEITGLELDEIGRRGSTVAAATAALATPAAPAAPAAAGRLQLKIAVTGSGKSVHQFAATASGVVTAAVQRGTVRDSLAEMTGVDLRGLGLLATKSQKEIPLRCAIADLEDRDGTLTARRLFADTESVLITGEGRIHFDTEALDLAISGHPKSVRFLRFQAPVLIKGTLTHPSVEVQAHRLTLVDPGTAHDADCGASPGVPPAGPG
jgi:uncharacterized protein involved in outer membrane biogenesis